MSDFPITNRAVKTDSAVIAILGPTNTGKTHDALEQMLQYPTGCIGFPLRLLARENYDKLIEKVGRHKVALVTGEEKIMPRNAVYYCCTVEAMPIAQKFDFLAVDEIQLAADPERGHVFTDRILRARGQKMTMFMGADTMKLVLSSLVPGITFKSRARLSELHYSGYRKITRLPKRSAVVTFSMDDVYAIAETMRRQRGGTAVVLGALSPRTRNAQVAMYQNGDVDFMVATDAIGMGLNMDINHIALAGTRKFDGKRVRGLTTAEMAQIAGRAGRYLRDGTFGVTGPVEPLDEEIVDAIENHRFEHIREIVWRNGALDFSSPKALLKSLERPSDHAMLTRGWASDDYTALKSLTGHADILALADNPENMRLLWEICQIPDFRKTLRDTHHDLLATLFKKLIHGPLPEDWVAKQIKPLDDVRGDVDTLMNRMAHVRTWTYISFKAQWLTNRTHWQDVTLKAEDRLSDALHEALMQRFVDRRASSLMKAIEDQKELLAGVRRNGEVIVESHLIGHLDGFRFIPDKEAVGADYKAVMAVARDVVKTEITNRLRVILDADPSQFSLSPEGDILFQEKLGSPLPGRAIARLQKGAHKLQPALSVSAGELADSADIEKLKGKLQAWLEGHIKHVLGPLMAVHKDQDSEHGAVRGICYQLSESFGIVPRAGLEDLIAGLDEKARADLRARRVRMGPLLIFMPDLNKPAAVRLRALLWRLWEEKKGGDIPPDGSVSMRIEPARADKDFYRSIGYPVFGPLAARIDMVDRVVVAVYENAEQGTFRAKHAMAEWLGCKIDDLYAVLEAMGHKRDLKDPAGKTEAEQKKEEDGESAKETASKAVPAEEKKEELPLGPDGKPLLARFYLKRGKAHQKTAGGKQGKAQHGKKPHKKKGKPSKNRVTEAPAKTKSDSPFAVLEQLKKSSGK